MVTMARRIGSAGDFLNRICEKVQPTESQYELAKQRYELVGRHLHEKDTAVERLDPDVFAQGSQLIRTTVRPVKKDRETVPFDLDAVCRCKVDPRTVTSEALYSAVFKRLKERADYADRITAEGKCLRLNYEADDFYLDIIPACADPTDADGIRLLIPDRSRWGNNQAPISTWRSTDPLRYAAWFDEKCTVRDLREGKVVYAKVHPLPGREPANKKAPLRRVVQLIKWKRNIEFVGEDCQPSSIFVTTLAANQYNGEGGLAVAFATVLDGMIAQIAAANGRRIVVMNPVEPSEDLAAAMTDRAYTRFCRMIVSIRQWLSKLEDGEEPGSYAEALRQLAGAKVAASVSAAAQGDVQAASADGRMAVTKDRSEIRVLSEPKPVSNVRPVRSNTFHLDG